MTISTLIKRRGFRAFATATFATFATILVATVAVAAPHSRTTILCSSPNLKTNVETNYLFTHEIMTDE